MASLFGILFEEKGYIPMLHFCAIPFSPVLCCEQLHGKLPANEYMSKVICVTYTGNLLFDSKFIVVDIKIFEFYVDKIFRDLEEYRITHLIAWIYTRQICCVFNHCCLFIQYHYYWKSISVVIKNTKYPL